MGSLEGPQGHGVDEYKATPEQLARHKAAVLGKGTEVSRPAPGDPTNNILGALAAVGAKVEVVNVAHGVADKVGGVTIKVTMPGVEEGEGHPYDRDEFIASDDA